jgi:hypothetical protein
LLPPRTKLIRDVEAEGVGFEPTKTHDALTVCGRAIHARIRAPTCDDASVRPSPG